MGQHGYDMDPYGTSTLPRSLVLNKNAGAKYAAISREAPRRTATLALLRARSNQL